MSNNIGKKIIEIEINKLDFDIYDSRDKELDRYKTKQSELDEKTHIEYLADSIKEFGQFVPIQVTKQKKSNGHYSIVSGRYRTQACQKLRMKKIKAIIVDTEDPEELEDIALAENIERLNLDRDEKLNAVLYRFKRGGYNSEKVMFLAKKLHNYGDKDIPKDFIELVKKSKYSPNTLYQFMQTIVQLNPKIQQLAKKHNLTMHQRILLTHTKLRQHPEIQKRLITRIENLNGAKSRLLVAQTIRDLETGAIIKQGSSYIFDSNSREKIETKAEVETSQVEKYLEIIGIIDNLMYSLTGHRIARGEFQYKREHVEYSEYHRLEILKHLTRSEVLNLEADLEILEEAVKSFLYLIQKEVMKE